MKRYAFLGMIAALLCVAVPAQADTYLSEVNNGLKSSTVYIAPGTEGTDGNTAATLQAQLYDNDNIVLIMLPASAESQLDGDLASFAKQLSNGHPKRIIGIVMGEQAVGFAPSLPTTVAPDLMHRAETVSTNNVETLITYTRNIHDWQRQHPEAKTTGKPTDEAESLPLGQIMAVLLVTLLVVAVALWVAGYYKRTRTGEGRTHFKAPDTVADQLTTVARLRLDVNDHELRSTLSQCCSDIERYFRKYSSDQSADAVTFQHHLTSVIGVLNKYIEVQDYPRDFNSPRETMEQAKESISDFADFVIRSIRSGNDARLIDYKVDTNILQARRFA